MARSTWASYAISLARILSLSALSLLPGYATAQVNLPDLTHRLTPLKPRPPAPNFKLEDLDGKQRTLSDYKGKVVLVNFWATWCPPCRREMPSMERIYQKLKSGPFTVLAVNQYENVDLVFSFTGQLEPQPTFPILFDAKSITAKQWGVKGLPASFVVDKRGNIAYRAMGGREFDHREIEKRLRELMAE